MQFLLPIIVGLSILLGYYVATKVPEELPIGKPWFVVAIAVFGVGLFFLLPWWKAAIVLGAALFGFVPALLGLGWAASTPSLMLTQLLVVLGMLVGTRWRIEKQKPLYLYIGTTVVTLAAVGAVFLGL